MNAAFLGDRRTLVTAGGKIDALGEVKLWDFPSGKPVGEFRGLRAWVEALAVSPVGIIAAGAAVMHLAGLPRNTDHHIE